jgi:hypothetical protein
MIDAAQVLAALVGVGGLLGCTWALRLYGYNGKAAVHFSVLLALFPLSCLMALLVAQFSHAVVDGAHSLSGQVPVIGPFFSWARAPSLAVTPVSLFDVECIVLLLFVVYSGHALLRPAVDAVRILKVSRRRLASA